MSIFVPLPVPGATITDATLKELQKRGVIPSSVRAFHAIDGLAAAFGGSLLYVPTSASKPKRWSETGTPTEYLTISGLLDAQSTATWSDFSMQVYGNTVARFYQDYAKTPENVLRWIPRFLAFVEQQPADMNFTDDYGRNPGPRMVGPTESPYPLGKVNPGYVTGWSWPTNHAARMNPETKLLEVFHIEDFMREYPIKTTVYTGDGGAKGTASVKPGQATAFLNAAAQGFFGGNHDAVAADVVSKFVEVK